MAAWADNDTDEVIAGIYKDQAWQAPGRKRGHPLQTTGAEITLTAGIEWVSR